MSQALYSNEFYESQIDSSLASAREIVPIVLDLVPAKSVCDVGCGAGTWLAAFKERGVETIQGYDGPWVQAQQLKISAASFSAADLSSPIKNAARYDLSMSVEVAEHLPSSSADGFVDTLTRLAPVVLFSAAVPNQGGTGHINEQWQDYWISKFAKRGFQAIDCLRPAIWNNTAIKYWYRQNLFLFASKEGLQKNPALRLASEKPNTMPANVVHPEAFIGESQPTSLKRAIKVIPGLFASAVKRKLG